MRGESQPRPLGNVINSMFKRNGLVPPPAGSAPQEKEKRFIFPILTSKGRENDFAESIKRYNQHIKKYNLQVWVDNAPVRDYNKDVIRHRKTASVSAKQKAQEFIWKEEHKHLDPEDYNKAVEKYNKVNGLQLRKKNLKQPVKKDSEKFFVAILHLYNKQLFRRKEIRQRLDINHDAALPKVEIYPNKLIEAERDGYKVLPVSVETVRHHRERLEEAGVLSEYEFRGDSRAVKMRINTDILSITDNGAKKNTTAENQSLKEGETKKVPHSNVSSRGLCVNKSKIRGKGVFSTSQKNHSVAAQGSTRSPMKQGAKNSPAGEKFNTDREKNLSQPAENSRTVVEKSTAVVENQKPVDRNPRSAMLTAAVIEKGQFVRELAANKFKKYRHLEANIVQQEAYYGAMHPEDFVELVIQDLFKYSSSIFVKLKNVHPGSWMNAYKIWLSDKFMSFNDYRLSKPNIFERWGKCIEVLREVKAYAERHDEWYPHYPGLYFDPARTQKEHNSFEFAYRNFRLEDEKLECYAKRKINANKSLRHKTDVKKAQEKIRQFLNGRMDLQEVYDYALHNLNNKVYQDLDTLFKREWDKYYKSSN